MSGYNGSGLFTFTYNWVNDAANGIPITASRMDGQFNDAVSGFDLCLTRDNQGKPSASFIPDTNSAYDLGSGTVQWRNVYANNIVLNNGQLFTQIVAPWTPTDTSGAGLSFTTSSTSYTRIGNIVYVYGSIQYPVTVDTAFAQIGGLPVASANLPEVSAIVGDCNDGSGNVRQINMIKNSTNFQIINSARGNVQNSQLSGATVFFTFFYPVT